MIPARGADELAAAVLHITPTTELRMAAEPFNPMDPQAVRLEYRTPPWQRWDRCGYVPRNVASRLQPELEHWRVAVYDVVYLRDVPVGLRLLIHPSGWPVERARKSVTPPT